MYESLERLSKGILDVLGCRTIASAIPMQVAAASLLYRKSMDAIPVGPDKEEK